MKLKEISVGRKARIVSIRAGQPGYRQRLIAMGLIPGTEFTVSRVAPLGDPVEINIRGFSLSLRRDEASILELEELAQVHM